MAGEIKLLVPRGTKPQLCGSNSSKKVIVDKDTFIKDLIKSKLLLDKEMNSLLYETVNLSKEINILISDEERKKIIRNLVSDKMEKRFDAILKDNYKKRKGKISEKEVRSLLKKEVRKIRLEEIKKVRKKISDLSNSIQTLINGFEKKKKIDLGILEHKTAYLCKSCKEILSTDKFKSIKCKICGKKVENAADADQLPVIKFNDSMIKFIENNTWLEYGIDLLLKKLDHNTTCCSYILGSSGILHEIDVIAQKKDIQFIGECKAGDISINILFILHGKMWDIGCNKGIIFTTSFDIKDDVTKLAYYLNIKIIDSVLDKSEKQIEDEIMGFI